MGVPPKPSAPAALAAAEACAAPSAHAWLGSAVILVVPPRVVHGAWGPTQMGSSFQPWPVTVVTHEFVRLGCAQPRFAPPMYTPTRVYGDDRHAFMVDAVGAAQASKPRVTPDESPLGGTHAASSSVSPTARITRER